MYIATYAYSVLCCVRVWCVCVCVCVCVRVHVCVCVVTNLNLVATPLPEIIKSIDLQLSNFHFQFYFQKLMLSKCKQIPSLILSIFKPPKSNLKSSNQSNLELILKSHTQF